MSIDTRVIDELLLEFRTPEQILGKAGHIKQLTKAVLERALDAELAHHLREQQQAVTSSSGGLEAPESAPEPARRNVRNGHSRKTIKSEHGQLTLEIPRDREASFEPILVPKHQRRLAGLDEKIIGLYACGMSERDISRQIQDRLRRRDQRQPHQRGHRRGDGRGHQLASQGARAHLPDRLPGRAGHQGPV